MTPRNVWEQVRRLVERAGLPLHAAAWLAVVAALAFTHPVAVTDVQRGRPGSAAPTRLPLEWQGRGSHVFQATFHADWRTPRQLTMAADDCVEALSVDDNVVFQESCAPCKHCKYTRFRLGRLEDGPHRLQITVGETGGGASLDIRQARGLDALATAVLLLAGWGVLLGARRLRVGAGGAWVALLGLVTTTLYHVVTDHSVRSHDVAGHREYVDHLLRSWSLPGVRQGWETWQPPLYYALSAAWAQLTSWTGVDDVHRRVQWVAAALYLCVVLGGLVAWRRFRFTARAAWLGPVLVVLIPAHVFLSGRVNNDAIMPVFGMALTWLGFEYATAPRARILLATSALLLLSLLAKTSSMSLVASAGLLVLWRDHVDGRRLVDRARNALVLGGPSAVWLLFWFWRNHDQTGEWMYVNANLQDVLKVPNVAYKYLSFDWKAFTSEGHFNTFGGTLRESFPTSLAASLLTGEFTLDFVGQPLLSFLRAAFLPMLLLFLVGLFTRPEGWRVRPWLPAVLLVGVHAFFMASYNWRFSFACNQDARLWSPVYFPAAVVWTWGYESALERTRGPLRVAVMLAPVVFVALLAAFWWKFFFP
ncbi:MAG: hypothetical protein HY904_01805 [Deltaproteobacteria bacterium]|nr:hypothetical protein [Deltaproteobacteria bacterium]